MNILEFIGDPFVSYTYNQSIYTVFKESIENKLKTLNESPYQTHYLHDHT